MRRRLLLALGGVLLVKLGVLWQLGAHPLLQPGGGLDADAYVQFARRVMSGDLLLAPGLYVVSPLYVYALAALLAIGGGSLWFVRFFQILLGTLACGLVWFTAREWFSERAAWIALALAAFTGVFTFYEVLILQASIDPFLTALDLWLLTLALGRPERRWAVLAGAALALHALNRPNFGVVLAGLAVLLLVRPARRETGIAFIVGAMLALLPVSARNYAVAGTFVPTSSHGGLNFYIGNNPRADGTYRQVEGITPNIAGQAVDARRVAERAAGRGLTDTEVSAYFLNRALAWWRGDPARAARLFARKTVLTLNRAWLTLNYSYPFYEDESAALRVLAGGPLLLVPLGFIGLFAHRLAGIRAPEGFGTWAAFVPLTIVSIALFFVASRYRMPLLVPLCITAAGFLDAALSALRARRLAPLAIAAACAVPAIAVAGWNLHLDDGRGEEETRMAVWLAANGRSDEAEQHLARTSPGPLAGLAHFRVGQALERAGDLAGAVRHYTRSTEIDPHEPDPRRALARASGTLGIALAQRNQDAEALTLLEQAARLAPDNAPAQLNLAVQYARMGRYADARASAERALKVDPAYDRARQFLKALAERTQN